MLFDCFTPRYLSVFLTLVTLTISGEGLGQHEEQNTALPLAPAWRVYNEVGELNKSSDYVGKPLIIHFWATWCPYCKMLQPGLDKLYRQYQDDGLQLIAVSILEDAGATPQAELRTRKMSFNTMIHGEDMADLFQVQGTPTTVFINRQGQVMATTQSSDPEDPRLEEVVKALIAN